MRATMARWREWVRQHPLINTTWRVGVFTVGAAVLLGGVAMLVLPGPGWAAIFVGFAILATEFAWAQTVLTKAKNTAQRAKDRALDPQVRRRNQYLAIGAGLLTAAAITAYLKVLGPNLPWNT